MYSSRDDTKSVATTKSNSTVRVERVSSTLNCTTIRRHRNHAQRIQNLSVIWLDSNIDGSNADFQTSITQLRNVVNDINTYTSGDECVQFIQSITDRKACMIVSGAVGQYIVPCVHEMPQIDSIFIYCSDKKSHEQWTKEWPKVKGIFTEISPMCEALKQVAQQCEQNAIPISFVAANTGATSSTILDQLDPSFVYTQILKEILLTIKFEEKSTKEFINYCIKTFAGNVRELHYIKKFKRHYRDHTPVWWYTYQCFLYPMLNVALRLIDADIIVRMGFFICDLYRDIQRLQLEQYVNQQSSNTMTVYRGQGLSKENFQQMIKTEGGFMSFNNFLFTSKNRKISLRSAHQAAKNPDLVGILFIMTIDPALSTTPFACVTDISHFHTGDEVLFTINTIFRIGDIKPMVEHHQIYEVNLTVTHENDKDLRMLTDRIRDETFPSEEGWYRLGLVLLKMGQYEKAYDMYELLLVQTTNESDKAPIYYQLGWAKYNQGKYQEAIAFYEKALPIYEKNLPQNNLVLGMTYYNIGLVNFSIGNLTNALASYEKALEIRQQSLPSNHPDLASAYDGIGLVHNNKGEFTSALSFYKKSLEIKRHSLPSNHPDLAMSYNNIGSAYYSMGDYSTALSSYERSLEIKQQSLPANHPDLAKSYIGISNVYYNMGDYSKALLSYETTLHIQQQSLNSNHPDLANSYIGIGNAHYNMGDYSKALSSYEKSLEIQQESLPINHPDLGMSYNNIGNVYFMMSDYSQASLFSERAVENGQKSLPPDHQNLQLYKKNLKNVRKKI